MRFTQVADALGRKQKEAGERDAQEEMRLLMLPIASLRPNPYQPRTQFDPEALRELADSIRENGLIQPLVVRPTSRGYELIAGERRLRACQMLHLETVPCILRACPREEDSALMALIENVQRRDLDFLEEAECYRAVLHTYGMTQEQLAEKLGKSQSFLANKLRLLQLPPAVRKAIRGTGLTERHARALLRLPNQEAQLTALSSIVEKQMNVKDTERLIARMAARPPESRSKPRFIRLFKDYRLFLNTVKCGADQLKETGLSVELITTDQEDGVDVLVRIRKPASVQTEPKADWPAAHTAAR
jgi:ParB family chromosome partitioning protein